MKIIPPWEPVEPESRKFLEKELSLELHPEHALFGAEGRALVRRCDQDDVLFMYLKDGKVGFADVHLTWSQSQEVPGFPSVSLYNSWQDFEEASMDESEAEDWLDETDEDWINHQRGMSLAEKSVLGISIGDAFGDSFFGPRDEILAHLANQTLPETKWEFTDDAVMAIGVLNQLSQEEIYQDLLALEFALNHDKDPNRGYGATTRRILRGISEGGDWAALSIEVFDGMGSMGNGAAMRVGPVGAYFHEDLERVKEQAEHSAEVTHANIEAIAGAMAVAIATALATKVGLGQAEYTPEAFLKAIIAELPDTDTRSKINKALSVPRDYHPDSLVTILGNGTNMLSQDTVPVALWCAAHHLNDYEASLWRAVSVLGDRDTICAIVGGITVMSAPESTIPAAWREAVEDFRASEFYSL